MSERIRHPEIRADVHECRARGCAALIPTSKLMCRRHWRMVPRALQAEVTDAWSTLRRKRHSVEDEATIARLRYVAALHAVIAAVNIGITKAKRVARAAR